MTPSSTSGEATRAPLVLRGAALASTFDRFAMPPMLVAMARDLDEPLAAVVSAAGVYFLAYGLMQPVWGWVSDRIGVVPTIRVSLGLATLASTSSAFASDAVTLTVTRGLAGACFAAVIPAGIIYIGDTITPALRQRELTRLMAGIAVGIAAGSAAGGVVADHVSWRAVFVLTGVAAGVLALAGAALPVPAVDRHDTTLRAGLVLVARAPVARVVLGLGFVEGAVLLGAVTLLPPAVEAGGSSTALAGVVTAVFGVSVLVLSPVVGRASQQVATGWLLGGGAVSLTLACALLALSRGPVVATVAAALVGAAYTSMHSSLQAWATDLVPAARATAVSLFVAMLFLGSAAAALAVGGLADRGEYAVIFAVAALAAAALGAAATLTRTRWDAAR